MIKEIMCIVLRCMLCVTCVYWVGWYSMCLCVCSVRRWCSVCVRVCALWGDGAVCVHCTVWGNGAVCVCSCALYSVRWSCGACVCLDWKSVYFCTEWSGAGNTAHAAAEHDRPHHQRAGHGARGRVPGCLQGGRRGSLEHERSRIL